MATETLESSISNQSDNIESWLDENLRYFNTVKHTLESQKIEEADYESFLDSYYGYNSNSPKGFYIGTASGRFYKAKDADIDEKDVLGSTWYKQGISRVQMAYGTAYTNAEGETVRVEF